MEYTRQRANGPRPAAAAVADDTGWLITLCDLTLLLLCFFIVLHVAEKRRSAGLVPRPQAKPAQVAPAEPPPPLTIAFALKQAELSADMLPVLDQAIALADAEPELRLEIVGHTDDRPIATATYPSNWELSAARAASAARYLIAHGVAAARIDVEGYADVRPLDAEARDANRRVEIRFA
ncbi:MAG TPA: OmpA family protein, partial [Candidatus Binatia bacterium]|nr:OmpA family protein [Candidatus Binatia bacterium]